MSAATETYRDMIAKRDREKALPGHYNGATREAARKYINVLSTRYFRQCARSILQVAHRWCDDSAGTWRVANVNDGAECLSLRSGVDTRQLVEFLTASDHGTIQLLNDTGDRMNFYMVWQWCPPDELLADGTYTRGLAAHWDEVQQAYCAKHNS